MKDYKKLIVWQKGIELVKDIYKSSSQFPKEELYGLTSQIRRSAVSVPSNIAEGSGRGTDKDYNRFLDIALGSSYELETQIIIAFELKLIPEQDFNSLIIKINEAQKMIAGLKNSLNRK